MKILVTGANGYLGTGVVKQLCSDGVNVVAACHSRIDNVDKRALIKQCNIFCLDDPYTFFEKPDVLLHLAWRNGFAHNAPTHIQDLPNHCTFIKKMIDGGCKQISIIGTMHEIGLFEGSVDEDTPTAPGNLYGVSKDALRRITRLFCEETNIVYQWLRGYYIVDNSGRGESIFSKITAAEKANRELFPFTMGCNKNDFIDYNSFCLRVATAVEQNSINGVINICSGQPETFADRVERFIKENGYKIKLDYGKFQNRPYDSKAIWGDDTKIRKIMANRNISKSE